MTASMVPIGPNEPPIPALYPASTLYPSSILFTPDLSANPSDMTPYDRPVATMTGGQP